MLMCCESGAEVASTPTKITGALAAVLPRQKTGAHHRRFNTHYLFQQQQFTNSRSVKLLYIV
jgi:hypothetical protein